MGGVGRGGLSGVLVGGWVGGWVGGAAAAGAARGGVRDAVGAPQLPRPRPRRGAARPGPPAPAPPPCMFRCLLLCLCVSSLSLSPSLHFSLPPSLPPPSLPPFSLPPPTALFKSSPAHAVLALAQAPLCGTLRPSASARARWDSDSSRQSGARASGLPAGPRPRSHRFVQVRIREGGGSAGDGGVYDRVERGAVAGASRHRAAASGGPAVSHWHRVWRWGSSRRVVRQWGAGPSGRPPPFWLKTSVSGLVGRGRGERVFHLLLLLICRWHVHIFFFGYKKLHYKYYKYQRSL